ncbi:AAA family ATPase [Microbacterium sp. ZW T5_56]|uniref:AAA family ATPase n=1 Tax=Microbacterium sp. ZW T5_56 TaxID=3378081 RepID=UPI003853C9B3
MDQGTTPAPAPAADHAGAAVDQDRFSAVVGRIVESVERVIDGKRAAIDAALVCLFAEGHLLIEDVPGVGKTMLARALAASVDAEVRRIQFTPDLLPGDVTGVSVFNPVTREFEFKPGAIFANVVIADEINRASPKTQSALLEAMEERQVTVDGLSRPLPGPFIVVATQNPLEMDGTYALPEAQRDRFLVRLSMGYPDAQAEQAMIRQRDTGNPLAELRPVTDAAEITAMIRFVRGIHVSPLIEEYVVRLAQATRVHPDLRLGASPRATLQLVRAAKVWAALDGRDFVLPDDVTDLLSPVFAHRLLPTRTALGRASNDEIIDEVLSGLTRRVAVPIASRR